MIRWFDVALVGMMVATAATTFWIKHDARRVSAEIASLDRRIASERTSIELLGAEWELVTQPDRLQSILDVHKDALQLERIDPDQFVTLEELENLLDEAEPNSIEDAIAGLDGADPVTTGATE